MHIKPLPPPHKFIHAGTSRDSNDRPGPDIPTSDNAPPLDQLVAEARAAEVRIAELEQTQKRTAKRVLLEVLDQAQRIATGVDVFGLSVAEFARRSDIEERRAQRVYKLAPLAGDIRKQVRDGEAEHGADYDCPSWKHFVPINERDTAAVAQSRLLEIGREIVAELQKGKKANKEVLHVLEREQAELRSTATSAPSPPVGEVVPKSVFDKLRAELKAKDNELKANDDKLKARDERIMELQVQLKRSRYGMYGRGDQEKETPKWLYDHFDRQFHFTCDAAASATNHKHTNYFDKQRDGLAQDWHGVIWLNPPYNDIERWLLKAWKSAQYGCTVVALVPLWVKMDWFQTIAIHAHIRLLSLRPSFVGYSGEPSFDFMVLVFTKESQYRDGRLHVTIEHLDDPTKTRRRKKSSAPDR